MNTKSTVRGSVEEPMDGLHEPSGAGSALINWDVPGGRSEERRVGKEC